MAVLTAAVIVLPVAFRLWLKAVHQNQPLPTQVYRDPVASLRVVAPAPATLNATIGTAKVVVGYPALART